MALINCPECKKKNSEKAKFCPECGFPINEKSDNKKTKFVAAKCPSCGANIDVNENSNKTKCKYCNQTIIVEEAIEKLKIEVTGDIEIKNIPKAENIIKMVIDIIIMGSMVKHTNNIIRQ